jgi:hypothetical protein
MATRFSSALWFRFRRNIFAEDIKIINLGTMCRAKLGIQQDVFEPSEFFAIVGFLSHVVKYPERGFYEQVPQVPKESYLLQRILISLPGDFRLCLRCEAGF